MKTEATRMTPIALTPQRLLEIAEATNCALRQAGLITKNGRKREARGAEAIARRMIACLSLSAVSTGATCEGLRELGAAWIEDQETERKEARETPQSAVA